MGAHERLFSAPLRADILTPLSAQAGGGDLRLTSPSGRALGGVVVSGKLTTADAATATQPVGAVIVIFGETPGGASVALAVVYVKTAGPWQLLAIVAGMPFVAYRFEAATIRCAVQVAIDEATQGGSPTVLIEEAASKPPAYNGDPGQSNNPNAPYIESAYWTIADVAGGGQVSVPTFLSQRVQVHGLFPKRWRRYADSAVLSADLPLLQNQQAACSLRVGVAGDVVVTDGTGTETTFYNVQVGETIDGEFQSIVASGTTAYKFTAGWWL